ncbi:rhodanese-like domain-containing protein [Haloferula chungangensis]|uniref:Rhodanese-like domain-containing protein n=1 Tax=Haloferula chungangensis TaxID=1048331 RepID=A0ABW2L5Q7_9BACT
MKTLKKVLWLWLAMSLAVFAETKKVEVEEAEKLVTDKAQVLDVRTQEEWDEGHLDGAVRVDFNEKNFGEKVLKTLDPKKPVLIYCNSGGRSGRATEAMDKLGFKVIYDLDGGIKAWKKAGNKVVK